MFNLILFATCVTVFIEQPAGLDYKGKEPYIYYLRSTYYSTYYVYPNFRDEHRFIQHLFDFANEHSGTINIVTSENDVYFDDGVPFYKKSIKKRHSFFFARPDSCSTNNEFIVVNYLADKDVDFHIETVQFENGIEGKKLKGDFKKINVNIIQKFLNYTRKGDYDSRSKAHSYIYELYDWSDRLIIKQVYTGKYFTIEMY